MNMLRMEVVSDHKVYNSKLMPYSSDNEFFTALVTLCDELGVEVPLWTTHEERILKRKGQLEIDMESGQALMIYNYTE